MTTVTFIVTVLVAYVVIDVAVTAAVCAFSPSVRRRVKARLGVGK